ncbi:hypothetical protein [Mesorhizobium sp.]|uniref:hypothetical protein n=1 Tax=Mesorhizobium sp. TaxID=1871066 RepID=UPI0012290A73|nr:hypothetical protein [Mesorhizobium sp.]TIL34266.1 MAG: hypothetical protein E5Y85_11025 [Mesorhizobium sp.]TIM09186.1 MAG: hypothetical protein E5Y62_13600 [Mesorhizobium sp.]
MFKLRRGMRQIELAEADLNPDTLPGSLLDRSANAVTNMLDRFRGDEVSLEQEIADLTERLRQTRVAITAFEAAGGILDGGKQSPIAADPDKVGRLVPGCRGSMRALAEADVVVDHDGKLLKSKAEPAIVHVHKDIRA